MCHKVMPEGSHSRRKHIISHNLTMLMAVHISLYETGSSSHTNLYCMTDMIDKLFNE